jgi:cardiolipin synthase
VNLADEYINRIDLFGHWKDAALMMKGEAVQSFTLLFLQMWNIDEEEPAFVPFMDGVPSQPEHPSGYVMPYGDSPLDRDKAGETVYMDMLYRANSYVHIMTPYLILDGEMQTALQYAAQRGIDVKLILPGIPDKKLAYSLAKAHYRDLLGAGVKIYEYTPGFVHAKVFVSDDCKAVTGTINLDYRSLYHHFECATYLYKTDCIPDIERDFQETLAQCRKVTEETMRKEKGYRFFGGLLRFLAPLM